MPTNYQRGRQFEYRTRDKLIKLGAVYVMRAAQSKGKVDLLALWERFTGPTSAAFDAGLGDTIWIRAPWIVQCKRDGRLPAGERKALLELCEQSGAIPILAKAGPNGRGVEFIDLREEKS